jgi:hypothetical protein
MQTFFRRIFFFFLPFLVGFLLLEIKLSQVPTYYSLKKDYFESQLSDIEILSTGSSFGNSINPEFLSRKGFNLFNDAEDIYYDVKIVEKYLDRMPNLKLVIIPIAYWTLEYRMEQSPWASREPFYWFLYSIPPQETISLVNPSFFSYTFAYGWKEVAGYVENGFASKVTQKLHFSGWREVGKNSIIDSPEQQRNGREGVREDEFLLMNMNSIEGNIGLLGSFIKNCSSRHIKVLLITTPVYHYYYDHLDPNKYQVMQDALNQLATKYHITYLNFLKDPHFVAEDFYSVDHLIDRGAEKFTNLLAPIIDRELSSP